MADFCKKLGNYRFSANYKYSEHHHHHIEINYVIKGRCIMTFQSGNVPLRHDECIVIASDIPHSFIVDGSQECSICQFEYEPQMLKEEMCFLLSGREAPYYKLRNCNDVLESLKYLYRYKNSSDTFSEKLFELEFQKLVFILIDNIKKCEVNKNDVQDQLIQNILSYLDEHYDHDICLEQVAKSNHISSSYLRRVFADKLGFSGIDYVTMLRLDKAKDLLKNSKMSISDIALRTGYNNIQYFSRMFKRKIGISPSDFRKQYTM